MTLETILTSTVVAAIVALIGTIITASITKHNSDRNNELKYITEERSKWRKYLRDEIPKLLSEKYEDEWVYIVNKLELNLNPYDIDDINLLILARAITNKSTSIKIIRSESLEDIEYEDKENQTIKDKYLEDIENEDIEYQFMERVSRLLKSDWERSKLEASKPRFGFVHKDKITMLGSFISSCILFAALICVWCNIYMTYKPSIKTLFEIEGINHLIENTLIMIILAIITFIIGNIVSFILAIIIFILENIILLIAYFKKNIINLPQKIIDSLKKKIFINRKNKIDIKTKIDLMKKLDKINVSEKNKSEVDSKNKKLIKELMNDIKELMNDIKELINNIKI